MTVLWKLVQISHKKLLLQPYINAALDLDIELIFYALERTLKGEWIFA